MIWKTVYCTILSGKLFSNEPKNTEGVSFLEKTRSIIERVFSRKGQ